MKKFGIFAAAFAILASASCMEETIAPETVTGDGASFTATRADYNGATKTVLVDGCKVEWKAGNQVLVFNESLGINPEDDKNLGKDNNQVFDDEAWKTGKWFKSELGGPSVVFKTDDQNFSFAEGQDYIMLHPAGGNYYGLCTDGARYMRFWLSDQTATPGTYNETYGYCAAKASDFSKPVVFKNLLPLLKFTVPASLDGRIKTITVTSNNPTVDGFVAGNMLCDYRGSEPKVYVFSEFDNGRYSYKGGRTSVSLNLDAGMAAGEYYLAIAPKTYSQGLKVTVTYKDGTTSTRSSSNPVELKSSVIYNMGNVGAENYTGHGITGLPYVFSLTATKGTDNVAKYLDKITLGEYTTVSENIGYRDCFLYENTGAVLQCRQAGRSASDTQAAAYWSDKKGLDNIPAISMVSSEYKPGYESYYKLTVPLRFQMPNKFRVSFGLRIVTGSSTNWSLKYSIDDETWYDGGSINRTNINDARMHSIVVDSKLTINEVLYLKLVPTGTATLYNGNDPWGKDKFSQLWGGILITDMSEQPATPKPDGAVYFEAFDKMVGGVDYLMGGQSEGTNRLGFLSEIYGQTIGSNSDTDPTAKPTVWNGLTCSTVAMRPGYAQIGRTQTNQGYRDWATYNNKIGKMVTPTLAAGNLTLSFKAMMYRCPLIGRTDTTPIDNVVADKIVVNVIGGGTFEDGTTTSKTISGVSYSAFQTQTLTIKGATADTQIEFTSPSDVPSTRWFIDDICVTKAE